MRLGRYNLPDTQEEYTEADGIGQGGRRANGRTLNRNGDGWFAGKLETDTVILRNADGNRMRAAVRSGQLAPDPVTNSGT